MTYEVSVTRFIFSELGIQNLKKTVHQTVALLDNWYWVNRCTSLFSMNGDKRLCASQTSDFWAAESNHVRFKPKHMLLLNDISKCFGYKNFRELEAVSKLSEPSDFILVERHSEYLNSLVKVFTDLIAQGCPLDKGAIEVMNVMAHMAVSAWQLNKPQNPVVLERKVQINNRIQGTNSYNLEIVRYENIWEFRLFHKHSSFDDEPFIIEKLEDETARGDLLPPASIYSLRDASSIVDSMENSVILTKHTEFSKSLSGDRHGVLPVIAYDKLYEREHVVSLLSHYHAIMESLNGVTLIELLPLIDPSDSIQSFRLLSYLDQLEFTHHQKHENAKWFVQPHDLKGRRELMDQTVGVYSKSNASRLAYVDGVAQFVKP